MKNKEKSKVGRPAYSPEQVQSVTIKVFFKPDELNTLKAIAKEKNTTPSKMIKELAKAHYLK